jgi:hypothetical protein
MQVLMTLDRRDCATRRRVVNEMMVYRVHHRGKRSILSFVSNWTKAIPVHYNYLDNAYDTSR